jgi:uncharacterized protein YbaR (Trm112 family)
MPIKEDLLEILCCPKTMTSLRIVGADALAKVNEQIATGQVQFESGEPVKEPLEEALVTVDAQRLYAIKDSIPVMLIDESIPVSQLGDEVIASLSAES